MSQHRLDEYDPRRARGGRPWRRIVQQIRIRGGDACIICGVTVDRSLMWPHPMSFSVDHIVPLARGGHPTDLDNLGPAHLACNNIKGDRFIGDGERANDQSEDW